MAAFEIYQDSSDEYRWRFRANNGEIVADSAEGYTNRSDCERGIEIVKSDAPSAAIDNAASFTSIRSRMNVIRERPVPRRASPPSESA